eukprot:226654_1
MIQYPHIPIAFRLIPAIKPCHIWALLLTNPVYASCMAGQHYNGSTHHDLSFYNLVYHHKTLSILPICHQFHTFETQDVMSLHPLDQFNSHQSPKQMVPLSSPRVPILLVQQQTQLTPINPTHLST